MQRERFNSFFLLSKKKNVFFFYFFLCIKYMRIIDGMSSVGTKALRCIYYQNLAFLAHKSCLTKGFDEIITTTFHSFSALISCTHDKLVRVATAIIKKFAPLSLSLRKNSRSFSRSSFPSHLHDLRTCYLRRSLQKIASSIRW